MQQTTFFKIDMIFAQLKSHLYNKHHTAAILWIFSPIGCPFLLQRIALVEGLFSRNQPLDNFPPPKGPKNPKIIIEGPVNLNHFLIMTNHFQ